jgi:hypothetical protein
MQQQSSPPKSDKTEKKEKKEKKSKKLLKNYATKSKASQKNKKVWNADEIVKGLCILKE